MPTRHPDQREKDLDLTARLYLQGVPQGKIAEQLGVHRTQINHDMKAIRERWRQSALVAFDEAMARELAKIDLLEATYWEAWQDARLAREVTVSQRTNSSTGVQIDRAQVRKDNRLDASPARYLEGVERCVDRRIRLLGLNPPERIVSVPASTGDWGMDVERLRAAEDAFVAALTGGDSPDERAGVVVLDGNYRPSHNGGDGV